MNIWINKILSVFHLRNLPINEQLNTDHKTNNHSLFHRFTEWRRNSVPQGRLLFNGNNHYISKNDTMCVADIPFIIPRQIEDIRNEFRPSFERVRLRILRMDEYLSPMENQARRFSLQDPSLGILALAEAANRIQKFHFREVLSVDEVLPVHGLYLFEEEDDDDDNYSMDKFFRQTEKIDPITDYEAVQNLVDLDESLATQRMNIIKRAPNRPSDMFYLKLCLVLEIQRDEYESCLRILLHDIIFKYHLADFRLRCAIHVRKPIEYKIVLEKTVHESHLNTNYSREFVLWSGDWIAQQEVELYIVVKIESLSINKYITSKFWDMAHLHVKNIPHGTSKVFLRELTPVSRPHRIHSHSVNVGQLEVAAAYWPDRRQLLIHIIKVSHSHTERLLRAPETFVQVMFQSPFYIYDIKETKISDRSFNPTFNEEFTLQIPDKIAVHDMTIDLIVLGKSSIHHHPVVLGVLTLSKHTDWFPVRKFWIDVIENPNVKIKDRFSFEGSIYD